jgi:protein-disulfide isomerase
MNEAVFKGCVDGKKYAAEVQADYEDGVKAGVNGTPGNFIIGKDGKVLRALPGAQSYEVFKAAIEEALKA